MKKLLGLLSITPLVLTACGSASLNTPEVIAPEPVYDEVAGTYTNTSYARFADERAIYHNKNNNVDLANGGEFITINQSALHMQAADTICGAYQDIEYNFRALLLRVASVQGWTIDINNGYNFDGSSTSLVSKDKAGNDLPLGTCAIPTARTLNAYPTSNTSLVGEYSKVETTLNEDLELIAAKIDRTLSKGEDKLWEGSFMGGTNYDAKYLSAYNVVSEEEVDTAIENYDGDYEWTLSQLSTDQEYKDGVKAISDSFIGMTYDEAVDHFNDTEWDEVKYHVMDWVNIENARDFAELVLQGFGDALPSETEV